MYIPKELRSDKPTSKILRPDTRIIRALWQHADGLNFTQLNQLTEMSSKTLTKYLDVLEKAGIISSRAGWKNSTIYYLTEHPKAISILEFLRTIVNGFEEGVKQRPDLRITCKQYAFYSWLFSTGIGYINYIIDDLVLRNPSAKFVYQSNLEEFQRLKSYLLYDLLPPITDDFSIKFIKVYKNQLLDPTRLPELLTEWIKAFDSVEFKSPLLIEVRKATAFAFRKVIEGLENRPEIRKLKDLCKLAMEDSGEITL